MSTLQTQNNTPAVGVKGISEFLNSESIKGKFTEILGSKGVGFISSVLSVVNSNTNLANADRNSIYTSALISASLDLPINPNLGLAFLIPYKQKQPDGNYKDVCQFQISYKGFIQLALRSGQYQKINSSDVREGELISFDRMTGEIKFDWIQDTTERLKRRTIGFVSYFRLTNGYESTFYMTSEEIEAHAKKYSQTYKKYGSGLWKDEFNAMSLKTVTKLNISKNGPLSIEMSKAVIADQAVIKNDNFINNETIDVDTDYVDNQETALDVDSVNEAKQRANVIEHIQDSTTIKQLEQVKKMVDPEVDLDLFTIYDDKLRSLKAIK